MKNKIVETNDEDNNVPSLDPVSTNIDINIPLLLNKFWSVTGQVLGNFEGDRAEIMEAIVFLKDKATGFKPNKVHIEQYVAALRTLSETNNTTTRVLEVIAKLISAGKGQFEQNINIGTDILDKILEKSAYDDEIMQTRE